MSEQPVSFYILQQGDDTARFRFACRLAQTAFKQKQSLYIHLDTSGEAQYLDELLWTFHDISFLPHVIMQSADDKTDTPIALGTLQTPPKHFRCLLNLSVNIPDFYSQFTRVLEIVPSRGQLRDIMRAHYRDYQQQHCQLTTHEVSV